MGAIHCPIFGEAFGTEVIDDGACDFSSSYILTADWTISGGAANYTPGSDLTIQQDLSAKSAPAGRYRLTFDITSGTGSVYPTIVTDYGSYGGTARTGVGTYSQDITLTGLLLTLRFTPSFGSAAVSIDNLSLRLVY